MADQTCGLGYVDGNYNITVSGYTYICNQYAATGDFTCDTIDVNIVVPAGSTTWVVGIGTISGSTFTVVHTVAIDADGDSGQTQYTAPTDFTSFSVSSGDYLFFYSDANACQPDRSSTPTPKGYGYASGDKTGDASFSFSTSTAAIVEVQLSGPEAGGNETIDATSTAIVCSGDADLVVARLLPAGTTAIVCAGDASINPGRFIDAATEQVVVAGAATLDMTRVLPAGTTAIVCSGDADIDRGLLFDAATTQLVCSGDASLQTGEILDASSTQIVCSGAGDLVVNRLLPAGTTQIVVTGDASINPGRVIDAATEQIVCSGDASLLSDRVLTAGTTAIVVTGEAVLSRGLLFDAATEQIVVTGDAAISRGLLLDAGTEQIVVTGLADLLRGVLLDGATTQLVVSGDATLDTGDTDNDIIATSTQLVCSGDAVLSLEPILYPFTTRKGFYGMRQIKYNTATVPIRFELPIEWDATLLSDLTLTIKDRTGTNIRSPESLTLYTATTLSADAARFAKNITLAAGSDSPVQGDLFHIAGVSGAEDHRVQGYDSTTRIVTLEKILQEPHDSGDGVYGKFGSIEIDTTTITTFPAGLVMTLVWTPTGTGNVTTESAQIALSQLDVEGLDRRFERIYTRAHEAFTNPVNRLADMLDEAERQVRLDLRSRNVDYDRIVDQDIIAPALMAKMAYLWALNGDDARKDERDAYEKEYSNQFQKILNMPLWQDHDQDLSQDTDTSNETTSHEHTFEGSW